MKPLKVLFILVLEELVERAAKIFKWKAKQERGIKIISKQVKGQFCLHIYNV